MPNFNLRRRILLIIQLLFTPLVVFSAVALLFSWRATDQFLEEKAIVAAHNIHNIFSLYADNSLRYAALIAHTSIIQKGAYLNYRGDVLPAIITLAKELEVDQISVHNPQGILLAQNQNSHIFNVDNSGDPMVSLALQGKSSTKVLLDSDTAVLKSVMPIFHSTIPGKIAGTVSVSFVLGDTFMQKIREVSDINTLLTLDHTPIASSFTDSTAKDLVFNLPDMLLRIHNKSYTIRAIHLPLVDSSGKLKTYMVRNDRKIRSIFYKTASFLALFFLILAAAGLILSYRIANSITTPLLELTKQSEILAAGDFTIKANSIAEGDELGRLSHSFNRMASSIHSTFAKLTQQQQELEKLSFAIEQTAEAIVITDPAGIVEYVNPAFETITGLKRSKVVGQKQQHPQTDQDEELCRGILHCVDTQKRWHGQINTTRQDGTLLVMDTSISPIFDQSHAHTGFVLVKRDITEQLSLEKRFQQAQKMESIGTLAGGIAHDFNNILSGIFGYTELAQLKVEEESDMGKALQGILHSASRAKELVQQILTFSRKSEQERKPLQVSNIVKEALKLLRSSIPSTIRIEQNILSNAYILADPTQLHQIVMNLCTNAYHAMKDDGGVLQIVLTEVTSSEDKYLIELKAENEHYLLLEIQDTGCGMTEDVQNKIFEPYFSTKKKGEGTGLGLSLVHGIVKNNHGMISVHSHPGEGTTFHVYFPIAKEEGQHAQAPATVSPLATGSGHVMVVDDEEVIRMLTREILTTLGYTVTTFPDGECALTAFSKQPEIYDLIITDVTMPGISGESLGLQAMKIKPGLPVILCTGYSEKMQRETASAMGFRDYLDKPISFDKLATTVSNVLS